MSAPKINPEAQRQIRQYFRQLNLLFIAFLSSIFLFMLSAVIFVESGNAKSHDLDTILLISAPLSSMALVLVAQRLYLGRVNPAKSAEKLHEKMAAYRSGVMLRFLLLDGAAFVQVIAFFLTENKLFLPIALVVATLFMLYRPTVSRFIRDLALSPVEERVMRDHSAR